MITFEEALQTMLGAVRRMPEEEAVLSDALDRVLARDIRADRDMPAADLSAMDGYACRQCDTNRPMRVVGTVLAGQVATREVRGGECMRIMTGAVVPHGADTVVMFEHAEERDGWVRVVRQSKARNVRQRAEDGRAGDIVLRAGTIISPAAVALLAMAGCDPVPVSGRPSVSVMATGDELVEPTAMPAEGKIRNTNGPQLCAQLMRMGIPARYEGIVPDNIDALAEKIGSARDRSDLILMSGGVSEGDCDLVPEAFRRQGYRLLFESVAMQPGRPTVFGSDGHSFCCGLPGNPVSTFVVFEILLKPFLHAMMGHAHRPAVVSAIMEKTYTRRKADRQSTIPVRFKASGQVEAAEYHGSAHVLAMSGADALVTIPAGITEIREGTSVHVRLI